MAFRISNKQAFQLWEEFRDNIRNSTPVDKRESSADQKKRIAHLEANPEKWFQYYFPKYCFAEAADFQRRSTERILNHPEWYEVRAWSRELAKSTRTMMEVLYLALTGKKKYVILMSDSEDNAIRLLMPWKANLEFNNRIIHDYGIQEQYGRWSDKDFSTRAGVAFRAIGIGQSPRGAKKEEVRPDVLIFDDLDTDEDCRNPSIIQKNWKWVEEAAIGTRSISKDTLILFCGNIIAKDCCVTRAMKFADHTDIINIRNRFGKSTWPAKNSETHINRVLQQKSYISAQKEYFNNPIDEGSVFKEMAYKPVRHLDEYNYLVCYTDPSFKDSKKNDYKATVLVGRWKDEFHIIKAFVEQTTTAKMVEWHYTIMDLTLEQAVYYFMEEVFIQDILMEEFFKIGKLKGRMVPLRPDARKKPDKFTRIESLLEPLNRNGKLFLNEAEKNNPHMERLVDQFKALSPGSRAHDDAPDAVEGAVWIINNKTRESAPALFGRRKSSSKKY